MKRITLLIIICLLFIPCIYADDEAETETETEVEVEVEAVPVPVPVAVVVEGDYYWDYEDDVNLGGFWIQDRGFEMALLYFNDIHFVNNFVSVGMILTEVIKIDLDAFPSVFQVQTGLSFTPFYFKYDSKRGWGFGLSTEVSMTGFTGINFDITNISDAKDKKSDFGFAAYFNVTPSAFFHIQDFKVSVMPTFFTPAAYATSNISYTLDGSNTYAGFEYDIRLYTPFDYDRLDSGIPSITPLTGMDISASVEYPLSKELGLQDIHSLLNFDVGAGFYSLPFIPGTMTNGVNIKGSVEIDASDDILNPEIKENHGEPQSFSKNKPIYRPFVMHFWANWKPLGTELITVTPLLGFAVNTLYVAPGSMEGGITGHLNLGNLFHVKLGINYMDRMWINSLFLALNLRAVEFNLGLSLRSQDFARSWNLSGLGVTLGGKIGW